MSLKIRIKNSIFPLLFLHESNEGEGCLGITIAVFCKKGPLSARVIDF